MQQTQRKITTKRRWFLRLSEGEGTGEKNEGKKGEEFRTRKCFPALFLSSPRSRSSPFVRPHKPRAWNRLLYTSNNSTFKSTNKIGTHYNPPVMITAFCSYSRCPQHIDRRWTFLDLPRQTAAAALHLSWILQRQHHPMFLYCRLLLRRYWLLEYNGRNSIKESENCYSTFQWWYISIVFEPDLKFSSIWQSMTMQAVPHQRAA